MIVLAVELIVVQTILLDDVHPRLKNCPDMVKLLSAALWNYFLIQLSSLRPEKIHVMQGRLFSLVFCHLHNSSTKRALFFCNPDLVDISLLL